jgi:hypothetical protein
LVSVETTIEKDTTTESISVQTPSSVSQSISSTEATVVKTPTPTTTSASAISTTTTTTATTASTTPATRRLKQDAAVVMPSGQSPFERLGMQFGSLCLSSSTTDDTKTATTQEK